MEFGGRYHFAADRSAVWAALNDAAVLKAVIPGCERLEWTSPTTLALRLADAPDGGTVLGFVADGHADGGIMRLGRALIGNSAQQIIDGFFAAIGDRMGTIVTTLPPG
jgi:carbon monoxide dehydrogenase subunit G